MSIESASDSFAAHRFTPLDIPKHLLEHFEKSPFLNFDPSLTPAETGIYGLYLDDELVYVGKATSKSHLRRRFSEHAKKIDGRLKIQRSHMKIRFLIILEEWVHYAEHHLIEHFSPEWNGTGFGSHIPGAGRPGVQGPASWDQKYPRR